MSHANRGLEEGNPEQVGFSCDRLARLTESLRQEVETGQLPGANMLIARHGKIAYFESVGYRDKVSKSPMTKDAIFRIYSMSKPITSVAAMTLAEQGRLLLE